MGLFDSVVNYFGDIGKDVNVSGTRLKTKEQAIAVGAIASSAFLTIPKVAATVGAAVSTIGKSFMKASLPTKAAVVVATPIAAGVLKTAPVETAKYVVKGAVTGTKDLVKLGSSGGEFIKNPTFEGALNIVKENKTATAIVVGTGAVIGGKSLINTYLSAKNISATKKNTEAMLDSRSFATSPLSGGSSGLSKDQQKDKDKMSEYERELAELRMETEKDAIKQKAKYEKEMAEMGFELQQLQMKSALEQQMALDKSLSMDTVVLQEKTPIQEEPVITEPKKKKTTKKKATKKKATKKKTAKKKPAKKKTKKKTTKSLNRKKKKR